MLVPASSRGPRPAEGGTSVLANGGGRRGERKGAHVVGSPVNRREVDVELLDDTRVERVVVHDENVAVPQSLFRLENETSLELLPLDLNLGLVLVLASTLALGRLVGLVDLRLLLPRSDLVGNDEARLVEAMKQNVLVALGTVTGKRTVPAEAGDASEKGLRKEEERSGNAP